MEDQSKVAEADYGEVSTWIEGEKERLEKKCEETLLFERRKKVGVIHVIQYLSCDWVSVKLATGIDDIIQRRSTSMQFSRHFLS